MSENAPPLPPTLPNPFSLQKITLLVIFFLSVRLLMGQVFKPTTAVYSQNARPETLFSWPTHIDLLTDSEINITTQLNAPFRANPAGDVNGDGFDDFLISRSNGINKVYLIYGGDPFPTSLNLETLEDRATIIEWPVSVYSRYTANQAGDVNGDGFDDFLIGDPTGDGPNNSRYDAGQSYLIYGAEALPPMIDLTNLGSAGVVIWGANINDASGVSVDGAGDVNGDGLADWLIGADGVDAPPP